MRSTPIDTSRTVTGLAAIIIIAIISDIGISSSRGIARPTPRRRRYFVSLSSICRFVFLANSSFSNELTHTPSPPPFSKT